MNNTTDSPDYQSNKKTVLFYSFLLVLVLSAALCFRMTGLLWGEYQYLHPDERFLVWVGSDISPVSDINEYFDTPNSSLNPNNRGHSFYVYGTFPMFLTRYLVEWIFGHSGFMEMTQVGRYLSALADVLTVFLVYLVAERMYDRRVGILAAAFSSAAVLQIQQSHFFTMDTFVNLFSLMAMFFAVRILMCRRVEKSADENMLVAQEESERSQRNYFYSLISDPLFLLSISFGITYGLAVASKLNAVPIALLLPIAMFIILSKLPPEIRKKRTPRIVFFLVAAAIVSVLIFRIFQPYAFSGPDFWGIKLNPQWVANIRELSAQSSIDVDFPPALQWARRSIWFSGKNMILWGLGLPLGGLALAGFLWVGVRILKGEWRRHVLLWSWTGFYFIWQSIKLNPTMRYQLLIYPTLAIFAAWAVISFYDHASKNKEERISDVGGHKEESGSNATLSGKRQGTFSWSKCLAIVIGGLVLVGTFTWAYAFTGIYARQITRVEASQWIYQNIPGPINLNIQTDEGVYRQLIPLNNDRTITKENPYSTAFTAKKSGSLSELYFPHLKDQQAAPGKTTEIIITVSALPDGEEPIAHGSLASDFISIDDPRGGGFELELTQPVALEEGETYYLILAPQSGNSEFILQGASIANEGAWDDGLPLRIDGYDGFGGIYPPGLTFEMYWDDNPDKLARFLNVIDQTDYILITSSRQWASLPRLPERFPMTTIYYRNLLGCPIENKIEWCYNVAEPGRFSGELGFELIKVFQSNPRIGSVSINDQFAEEVFTVYDHPKVFVFKKSKNYNPEHVKDILSDVDFSQVIRIAPLKAGSYPANLMLPQNRLEGQQQGGSWQELYDPQALQNRNQIAAVIIWYLSVAFLGWLVYPIVRFGFSGLSDRGYPLARIVGLLIISYLVWLLCSNGIPFRRYTISFVILLVGFFSGVLAFKQRGELSREWREKRGYFLAVEGLFLAFFLLDLLIRFGNPDLWHPWKGGEKPMDFAYLNAVLKSTSFPPFDPWFAGGYLNYYYYGFVFVGVLIKWLGIVPALAYNLIIPTIFGLMAVGAFSVCWNLCQWKIKPRIQNSNDPGIKPYLVGFSAALGMAFIGNLGTVRMIFRGYQKLIAPEGVIENAGVLTRWVWAIRGFAASLSDASLPYNLGDWYWIPSRVIPAPGEVEPITEFPFFTVLYGDPHAHLFALPITLLALSFAIAVILIGSWWKNFAATIVVFIIGGMAIGSLKPTNTWDFYPYLGIGCMAVGYAGWKYYRQDWKVKILSNLTETSRRLLVTVGGVVLLIGTAFLLFQPFNKWYGLGYGSFTLWKGSHTPISAYLTHWGFFLFLIVTWMIVETIDWMACTPVSSLRKLEPYKSIIYGSIVFLLVSVFGLLFYEISISPLVIALAVWAGVLLLRPGLQESRRIVLFLIGTGLTLTLVVEVIVLRGDIARMNTVFKFYLQVWTLFAVSAAASFGWIMQKVTKWNPRYRTLWQIGFTVLAASTFLYPLLGGVAKVKDRMAEDAPLTLNGMDFMKEAYYKDQWGTMDLSQDYRAIRWMQDHVEGSPVIVEANLRNLYRWGSRYSIYTGLPGVVGWEWHQQQQRALLPANWITDRIEEIDNFYTTTDVQQAQNFLSKYDVRYIILGQQERGHYPGPGLEKFSAVEGIFWRSVYQEKETAIYEVIQ